MNVAVRILRSVFLMAMLLPSFQAVRSQVPVKLRSAFGLSGSSGTISILDQKYYVQHITGQSSVIGLSQRNHYRLRQGFIQPLKSSAGMLKPAELGVTVSPDPFTSELLISFTEKISDDLYISLHDLNGRMVYYNKFGASQVLSLDLDKLPPALYMIRVFTDEKYFTTKLIKE